MNFCLFDSPDSPEFKRVIRHSVEQGGNDCVEEKRVKRKRVESLYHAAVAGLPDAELSSQLLTHADKYLDYLRR